MDMVCPYCRTLLDDQRHGGASDEDGGVWICTFCNRQYPVRYGVVCFLDSIDDFYEGRFSGTHYSPCPETFLGRLVFPARLAWSLDMRYLNLLRRFLPQAQGGRILDMGCGGGRREILAHGASEVVGLDISLDSLRCALGIYSHGVQASASRIPFPDGHFDAVVSSNFLGHVPFEEKSAVYGEMTRVLRGGGLMLHQLETSSNGALFRFARQYPEFYQERLVDLDGHVGLELPSEALERFREAGLEVVWSRTEFVWYFLPPGEALKRFDNDTSRRNFVLRSLLVLDRFLEKRPCASKVASLQLGMANDVCSFFVPQDRQIGLCVALRKKHFEV